MRTAFSDVPRKWPIYLDRLLACDHVGPTRTQLNRMRLAHGGSPSMSKWNHKSADLGIRIRKATTCFSCAEACRLQAKPTRLLDIRSTQGRQRSPLGFAGYTGDQTKQLASHFPPSPPSNEAAGEHHVRLLGQRATDRPDPCMHATGTQNRICVVAKQAPSV